MHELIDRCKSGDRQAFTELVVLLRPWALAYAGSMLSDESLARDAVQESMIILLQRIGQLRSNAAFMPWMRSILRSQVMRILRRRHELELEAMVEDSSPESPLDTLELNELRLTVQAALARLSPDIRQTVDLFYMRERSVAEVSVQLGVPAGTVKRRLHDARRRLRDLLSPREGITKGSIVPDEDVTRINL